MQAAASFWSQCISARSNASFVSGGGVLSLAAGAGAGTGRGDADADALTGALAAGAAVLLPTGTAGGKLDSRWVSEPIAGRRAAPGGRRSSPPWRRGRLPAGAGECAVVEGGFGEPTSAANAPHTPPSAMAR